MIRVTKNGKVLIWYNENYADNDVQFPIPSR